MFVAAVPKNIRESYNRTDIPESLTQKKHEGLRHVLHERPVFPRKGDYNQAIVDYTKAIEIDPDYADAYHDRGLAWVKKGDQPPSLKLLRATVTTDNWQAFNNWFFWFFRLRSGNYFAGNDSRQTLLNIGSDSHGYWIQQGPSFR